MAHFVQLVQVLFPDSEYAKINASGLQTEGLDLLTLSCKEKRNDSGKLLRPTSIGFHLDLENIDTMGSWSCQSLIPKKRACLFLSFDV